MQQQISETLVQCKQEPEETEGVSQDRIESSEGGEQAVAEQVTEETFLSENLFENALITKAFEEDEVFVNEVTIEDTSVKEEPVEVSQE